MFEPAKPRQGQNYVVDVMMKAGLPERETFCLFLYLLRQGHLHGIYRKEVSPSSEWPTDWSCILVYLDLC